MEKFIPYEKLSKKEKRKLDQAKRQTWGEINPVTRKPTISKAYNRRKSQDWQRELPPAQSCDFSYLTAYTHNQKTDVIPAGKHQPLFLFPFY